MKWIYTGVSYANVLLMVAAFIFVCTWKEEKKGKPFLALAALLFAVAPVLYRLRHYLVVNKITDFNALPDLTISTIAITTNLTAHVMLLTFVIIAGTSSVEPTVSEPQPQEVPGAGMSGPLFLYIPVSRLVFMSIVSLGIYEVYWIYKNWRFLKERDHLAIQPFWRGVFGIFFCHALLRAIHDDRQAISVIPASFSPNFLATGWVALLVISNLVSRIPEPLVAVPFFLLSLLSFLFFVPVQNYINTVNESSGNAGYYHAWSTGHIVCLIVGVILWPLVIVGLSAG